MLSIASGCSVPSRRHTATRHLLTRLCAVCCPPASASDHGGDSAWLTSFSGVVYCRRFRHRFQSVTSLPSRVLSSLASVAMSVRPASWAGRRSVTSRFRALAVSRCGLPHGRAGAPPGEGPRSTRPASALATARKRRFHPHTSGRRVRRAHDGARAREGALLRWTLVGRSPHRMRGSQRGFPSRQRRWIRWPFPARRPSGAHRRLGYCHG